MSGTPDGSVSSVADAIAGILDNNPLTVDGDAQREVETGVRQPPVNGDQRTRANTFAEPDDDESEPPAQFQTPQEAARNKAPEIPAKAETSDEDAAAEKPETQVSAPDVTAKPRDAMADPEVQGILKQAREREQQAETARNQHLERANQLLVQVQGRLASEFQDVKTLQDLENLAINDPQRYLRYDFVQKQYAAAQNEQQRLQNEAQQAQVTKFKAWQQEQLERLPTLIPELNDKEKAPLVASKIREHAIKLGYTPEQLSQASAVDFQNLYKSMRYDELMAENAKKDEQLKEARAKARQKAAVAPPVQRPGTPRAEDRSAQEIQTDYRRLQRSGRVDDAAELFRKLGF